MLKEDENSTKLRQYEWAKDSADFYVKNKSAAMKERLQLDKEDQLSRERELDELNKLRYRLKLKLADRLGMYAADLESQQFEAAVAEEIARQQLHEQEMFSKASIQVSSEILEAFI